MRIKTLLLAASMLAAPLPALAQDVANPAPMTFPGWGVDLATLDKAVDPGDDFNAFVNGKWAAATPIPAKFPVVGSSLNLTLEAEEGMKEVIDAAVAANAPAGSIQQKLADTYKGLADIAAIDAAGMAPAMPYIDRVAGAKDLAALAALWSTPIYASPIGFGAAIDPDNSDRLLPSVGFGGLGLPARDNYLVENDRNKALRAAYIDTLAFMLAKAGRDNPKARAERLYAFEKQTALNSWDPALARNPELRTTRLTRAEVNALATKLPLAQMMTISGVGYSPDYMISRMPPSAAKLAKLGIPADVAKAKLGGGLPAQIKLVEATPLDVLKDFTIARFVMNNAIVLPSDVDRKAFEFTSVIQGTKVQRPREERAVRTTDATFGEAVGKLYVERHFPASSKAAMIEMVDNIRKAMALNIADVSWMSPATKTAAKAKLDAINVKIGYPNKWEDYHALRVVPGKPLENRLAVSSWQWADTLHDLKLPLDREEWQMTPQTVNAYYSSQLNEIAFPAAYLQAPNFAPSADPAVNYAAIGSTIGHEIGHGFDDGGSRYDAKGNLKDWWTPQDLEKFRAVGKRLVDQYGANCPYDDGKTCINGQLTLGENIGDLSGIAIAYRAWKLSLGGKEAPVIDGLTGDQRFFIGYAQKYRNKWSEQLQRMIMESDPHSPDAARVNEVLRNFDPWYAAFNVTPDDKMYLPPEKRVKVW